MSSSLQQNLSFDPKEYFVYASSIVRDSGSNEAALRSAISRVYYSLFLITRDRLFGLDEVRLTNSIRKRIINEYQLQTKKPLDQQHMNSSYLH
jgi:hypothetical protein